jgi:GH43 family beta-xylosidase
LSEARSFTNPLVKSVAAPDPWVVLHDGRYHLTATLDPEGGIWVWRSPTLTGFDVGEKKRVWETGPSGPLSAQVWAPELHFFDGLPYIYFTASDGVDDHHRHYVLRGLSGDALGPYAPPQRLDPELESYGIDGTVLEMPDGRLYFLWAAGGIFITPMDSPTRVRGPRVKIARGDLEWERGQVRRDGVWVPWDWGWVEAPQALVRDGRVYVAYSAGHSATEHYRVGLLNLVGDDPLDPAAWVKSPNPVFEGRRSPDGDVFTTGHCSFTTSRDGTEDWIVYHGKDNCDGEFTGRTARAQPFTFKPDGTPDFGHPVPCGVPIPVPSGE